MHRAYASFFVCASCYCWVGTCWRKICYVKVNRKVKGGPLGFLVALPEKKSWLRHWHLLMRSPLYRVFHKSCPLFGRVYLKY